MSTGLRQRTNHLASTGKSAVTTGAYFYPLNGIAYFITHSALHKPLYRVAVPATLLSLGVLAAVFGLLYLPQVAALAIVNGPVAFVNAALLCLSESSFLITALARAFLLEDALLEVFDATLLEKGLDSLVSEGRELKKDGKRNSISKLGKLVTKPLNRFSPRSLLEYAIFLPLNAIPIVGTAAFVLVQGYRAGPRVHGRYFDLKKFTPQEKADFIHTEQGAYTAFGVASALLGMIPFASIPIQFTNTVGAALWASNIETKGVKAAESGVKPSEGRKEL